MSEKDIVVVDVLTRLQKKDRFTLDTNRLVILGQNGEVNVLESLIAYENYILTSMNYFELTGLAKGDRISKNTWHLLSGFMKKIQSIPGRYIKVNSSEIEKELRPFDVLIPRKLVHDVIINLPDSFLNKLIERYTSLSEKLRVGQLNNIDIKRAQESYQSDLKEVDKTIQYRFHDLCAELNLDPSKIDQKTYFARTEKFKNQLISEMQAILKTTRNFNIVIISLKEIAKKNYEKDIRYVAQTIAAGAAGDSSDSDVIFLFEVHNALKVA